MAKKKKKNFQNFFEKDKVTNKNKTNPQTLKQFSVHLMSCASSSADETSAQYEREGEKTGRVT